MIRLRLRMIGFLLAFALISTWAWGQSTALLTEKEYRALVNEISGDTAMEHIRFYSDYHRPSGSQGFETVLQYFCNKAKEYGLQDVRVIRQYSPRPSWTGKKAELWMVEPQEIKITSLDQLALSLADYSRNTDVTAELVDVGQGDSDADYQGKDVKGKIVLSGGSNDDVMEQAVWKRGALGIVSYNTNRDNPADHLDQVAWLTIPFKSEKGAPGTFGFVVSPHRAMWLRDFMRSIRTPVKLHALVVSEFVEPSWQAIGEGFIKGTDHADQDVVVTSHLQEGKGSANDDGSGAAAALEAARALVRLIREGKIERPKRNIRFWWTTENWSERQFFSDFPDERKKMLVDINLDMVGANQTLGSRVQHVARTPFSRPGFLSDVAENIVNFTQLGNTSFYSSTVGKQPYPFTKPILAQVGTRNRYNVLVLPFFNGSDHQQFNEAGIGVPAIDFTNWPDETIHSTDDDVWSIDPTQLQRNTFAGAAIVYVVAAAGEASMPTFTSEVYASALSRIGRELKLAMQFLTVGPREDLPRLHAQATNQLHQAVTRETQAVLSVGKLGDENGRGAALVSWTAAQLAAQEKVWQAEIDHLYTTLTGTPPPPLSLTESEKQLAKKIPVVTTPPKEFYAAKLRITPVPGLHTWMAYEILLFVDGQNSFLDIMNAVEAEALSAGDFYYGQVTPEMVRQYLDNAVSAGAIRLKP